MMIKLLKYDWKKNATTLLGALAVLLIVQVAITVTGSVRGWEPGIMFGLSMLAYGSANVLLLVVTCKTFDNNIIAYHRRLLPVHSVWTIVSSLVLAFATLLVLTVLLIAHAALYWSMSGLPWEYINFTAITPWEYVTLLLLGGWKFVFLMITIFFAIVVSRSITKKGSVWIGIIVFFVLHSLIGWLTRLIFGSDELWVGPATTFDINNDGARMTAKMTAGEYTLAWGGLAFEVAVAAVIVYAIVYLIDRKMER